MTMVVQRGLLLHLQLVLVRIQRVEHRRRREAARRAAVLGHTSGDDLSGCPRTLAAVGRDTLGL